MSTLAYVVLAVVWFIPGVAFGCWWTLRKERDRPGPIITSVTREFHPGDVGEEVSWSTVSKIRRVISPHEVELEP